MSGLLLERAFPMLFGSSSKAERQILLVDGMDHLTIALSDEGGHFPSRCDVFTRAKGPCSSRRAIEQQTSAILREFCEAAEITQTAAAAYYVGEIPTLMAIDSWFEIPSECLRTLVGSELTNAAFSTVWNHYHDHHAASGREQFHIKLQEALMSTADSDHSSGKLRILSLATATDQLTSQISLLNSGGFRVQQILSVGLANAYRWSTMCDETMVHLEVGWFQSDVFSGCKGIIHGGGSVPVGLFHFVHDLTVGLDLGWDEASSLLKSNGWSSLLRSGSGELFPNSDYKRARYGEIVEARLQEFLRLIVKRLHRIAPAYKAMPLSIAGHSAPGLKELIRLVAGMREFEAAPKPEIYPRFIDGSDQSFPKNKVSADLTAAIRYLVEQRKGEVNLEAQLSEASLAAAKQSTSAMGWLREML
jgi:hypothetical protein